MKSNIIILKVLLTAGVASKSVTEGHSKKQNIKIDPINTYSFLLFLTNEILFFIIFNQVYYLGNLNSKEK
jgi:hypothetical protein